MTRAEERAAIGRRAWTELVALYGGVDEAAAAINVTRSALYYWYSGRCAPDAPTLKRMAEMGLDVVYILTGKRRKQ
jgi:hypothetical protein